jgi:hypothetical protein
MPTSVSIFSNCEAKLILSLPVREDLLGLPKFSMAHASMQVIYFMKQKYMLRDSTKKEGISLYNLFLSRAQRFQDFWKTGWIFF